MIEWQSLVAMLAELPPLEVAAAVVCAVLVAAAGALAAWVHLQFEQQAQQPPARPAPARREDIAPETRMRIATDAFACGMADARAGLRRRACPWNKGTRQHVIWAIEYAAGYEQESPSLSASGT